MTEVQSVWIQQMLRPDAFLTCGVSLIIIGGIILAIGKFARRRAAAVRADLMDEARRDRDNPRQEDLRQEIRSIQRMPQMGIFMIVFGCVTLLAAIVLFILR